MDSIAHFYQSYSFFYQLLQHNRSFCRRDFPNAVIWVIEPPCVESLLSAGLGAF